MDMLKEQYNIEGPKIQVTKCGNKPVGQKLFEKHLTNKQSNATGNKVKTEENEDILDEFNQTGQEKVYNAF